LYIKHVDKLNNFDYCKIINMYSKLFIDIFYR
jgi:hypothetical protein